MHVPVIGSPEDKSQADPAFLLHLVISYCVLRSGNPSSWDLGSGASLSIVVKVEEVETKNCTGLFLVFFFLLAF